MSTIESEEARREKNNKICTGRLQEKDTATEYVCVLILMCNNVTSNGISALQASWNSDFWCKMYWMWQWIHTALARRL